MSAKKAATHKAKAADSAVPQELSFSPGTTTDQPAPDDTLGFKPYVTAIAEFLMNPATRPPLTISIEGEWGSGKSSFMMQLRERLKSKKQITVDFNAWRHDSDKALWAAFAIQFWEQSTAQLGWRRRQWARLCLIWHRFELRRALGKCLRDSLLLSVLLIPATFVLFRLTSVTDMADPPEPFGWLAGLVDLSKTLGSLGIGVLLSFILSALPFLWRVVVDLSRSFASYVSQFVDSPRYEDRVAFVQRFHEDFKKMVASVAKGGDTTDGGAVYVFIDDLDRCQVPRAAELMQALNLMISDDPRIVFIIGMDREKIAAGFAVKHEKLLPYLNGLERNGDGKPRDGFGIEYGYTFIEKFIQLPFVVPQPGQPQIETYLAELATPEDKAISQSRWDRIGRTAKKWLNKIVGIARKWERLNKLIGIATSKWNWLDKILEERGDDRAEGTGDKGDHQAKTPEQEQRRSSIRLIAAGDSTEIRTIAQTVAPALNFNPRRLKQFVNLFRLRLLIAVETGLFDTVRGERRLSLEQLGKFVVVQLKWPLLLADLERHPELWAKLYLKAFDQVTAQLETLGVKFVAGLGKRPETPASLEHWLERRELLSLLKAGIGSDSLEGAITERWFLDATDIQKLQQVFPRFRTVDLTTKNATGEPGAVELSGAIAGKSDLQADLSVEEAALAGDSVEAEVDSEIQQAIPSFLVGEWALKYRQGDRWRDEQASIDADGNYTIDENYAIDVERRARLGSVTFNKDDRRLQFTKNWFSVKRSQTEVLTVDADCTIMKGYAEHDGHELIYRRVGESPAVNKDLPGKAVTPTDPNVDSSEDLGLVRK